MQILRIEQRTRQSGNFWVYEEFAVVDAPDGEKEVCVLFKCGENPPPADYSQFKSHNEWVKPGVEVQFYDDWDYGLCLMRI